MDHRKVYGILRIDTGNDPYTRTCQPFNFAPPKSNSSVGFCFFGASA